MYDTTNDESNGESVSEEKGLNVNAAASTRPKKSILKRNGKKTFNSSEMPAGSIHKMMADKQLEVRDPVTKQIVSYMTYSAKMANVDYTRFDSLVTEDVADQVVNYNANLLHAYEVEYKANLLKQDRIIGGKHLALADGGANGNILALDMRILYFNSDGKRVSIGIAGDHQLIGNRLCCG